MNYTLIYHHLIKKDISKLPENIKKRIRIALEEKLLYNPARYGTFLKKSLRGYQKLRVGDYRIIYQIKKSQIIILLIGHRKDVYNKVERRKETS